MTKLQMKFVFALLLPLMLLGSPAKADDAKTIAQRLDDSWIAAYNKDDAAGVAALYASDAALLPQGTAQPVIGASKIREFLDGFMKQKVSNLRGRSLHRVDGTAGGGHSCSGFFDWRTSEARQVAVIRHTAYQL
jgi:hypothetical protein